jgi:hypothetical protein
MGGECGWVGYACDCEWMGGCVGVERIRLDAEPQTSVLVLCLCGYVFVCVIRYDKLKVTLASNEAAKALDANEQKLKHYEQSIFAMKECTFSLLLLPLAVITVNTVVVGCCCRRHCCCCCCCHWDCG